MKLAAAIVVLALGILAIAIHQAMRNRSAQTNLSGNLAAIERLATQGTAIQTSRINHSALIQILNYGEVRELNSSPPKPDQELRLRLYAVPQEGNCVPDATVVCSHHYYLAVSAYLNGLGEAVYDLGEMGEIGGVEWLPTKRTLTASVKLHVTNYPEHVITANKSLVKAQRQYELEVSLDRLSVTSVK
jgi:hypothetical protein